MRKLPRSIWLLWIFVPFLAFLSTLQGRISYWDTGEMQTVPWIFGIPHPTGFPAYVLLAGAFAHLFPLGPVSWRTAFFCAMLMVATVALVYAIVVRITGDRWSGACAGWLLAFGTYFWSYGARAEIHDMAVFFAALVLYFALRGYYEEDARAFYGASLALGAGLATHPIVLFVLPSLLLLALSRARVLGVRGFAAALGLMLVPLLLYAYLPLRSHLIVAQGLDPNIVLGKPAGAAIWNTDNPQTAAGFVRLVTGSDFHAARSILWLANVPAYAKKIDLFAMAMYREFTPIGIVAAGVCFVVLLRRRAVVATALLLALLLPAAFALAYPPVIEIERYFFIPMFALAAIVGLGTTVLDHRYRNLLRVPVAAAAVILLVTSYPDARLRSGSGAEGLIAEVQAVTPSNAIIMADWTRGTALAYAAYVDHRLASRTIDIAWPYQEVRYVRRWIVKRPVYYVGRDLRFKNLWICPVSPDFPVYAVGLHPGQC